MSRAVQDLELFAWCRPGLDALLIDELAGLGIAGAQKAKGGVRFTGPLEAAYRVCLWSHLAGSVELQLVRADAEEHRLSRALEDVDWGAHIGPGRLVSIRTTGRAANLLPDQAASLARRAIAIALARRGGEGARFVALESAELALSLHLARGEASVALDLAGAPLDWRTGEAVSREDAPASLIAALLVRADWPEMARSGASLIDPMAGRGALAVEAGLYAADVAPGLLRDHFAFTAWRGHDAGTWRALRHDAVNRQIAGLRRMASWIGAAGGNPGAGREKARRAGLGGRIAFEPALPDAWPLPDHPPGLVASALDYELPPYNVAGLGRALGRRCGGWKVAMVGSPSAARALAFMRLDERPELDGAACSLIGQLVSPAIRAPVDPSPAAPVESDSADGTPAVGPTEPPAVSASPAAPMRADRDTADETADDLPALPAVPQMADVGARRPRAAYERDWHDRDPSGAPATADAPRTDDDPRDAPRLAQLATPASRAAVAAATEPVSGGDIEEDATPPVASSAEALSLDSDDDTDSGPVDSVPVDRDVDDTDSGPVDGGDDTASGLIDSAPVDDTDADPTPVDLDPTDAAANADRAPDATPAVSPDRGTAALSSRLRKNLKRLARWVRSAGIDAYRVYERDLPEYNAIVDRYGTWLHVQELAAPAGIDPAVAARRLAELVQCAGEACEIPAERIAVVQRRRQRGADQYQYERRDDRGGRLIVREGSVVLWVNLTDYLDTGLFLDHRPLRRAIAAEARGKRFLNLFCYTASATVHAATGGAAATTSVDLSPRYLEWAARNLAANGMDRPEHALVRADAVQFLSTPPAVPYDLVLLDPPTFSNSKRTRTVLDIQRDHVELIALAARQLARGGRLYFSNNARTFALDEPGLASRGIALTDITAKTIDPDFPRKRPPHRCWVFDAAP